MYSPQEHDILQHLASDRVMASVIRQVREAGPYSFPVPTLNVYRDLLEAVIYQQVSIRAAKSIFDRFRLLFGEGIDDPATLVEMDVPALRSCGISGRKVHYLQNIAAFFDVQPGLSDRLRHMPDDEVIDTLIRVKGIGPWTAKMTLMFSLGRPDVFPIEDLGIRQAIAACYGTGNDQALMQEIAAAWRPFRTFACHLLWRWKRIDMGIDY